MDLVAHLEQILYRYVKAPPVEELRIIGWRFAVSDMTVVKAGIRNNRLGDVYASPSINSGYAGDLLIIWPGERCSHAVINTAVVRELERKLQGWKQGSFRDPEGSALLEPQPLPLVGVEHQQVKRMVQQDPRPLFDLLARFRQELPEKGADMIQAGVQAGWGLRHVRTSKGLAVSYAHTTLSAYAQADGLYGRSFAKRRPPSQEEAGLLIENTAATTKMLKKEGSLLGGKMTVIFAPELVEAFCAKYLLTNLSGNNVVHKQAAYTVEDFVRGQQVFDPRLSLAINPLKDMEISSYLCTREGLPARKEFMVQRGKLVTPYLTVKDSIKAGLPPTPLPQGQGLWLDAEGARNLTDLIEKTENGILVYSVLGLHTQDSVSGSYSLAAPQCLKIEKGKITGRVRTVIAGNFLEHLADPGTDYGLEPGENFPAIKFRANVARG